MPSGGPQQEKNESENKNKTKISRPGRGADPGSLPADPHPSDRGSWAREGEGAARLPVGFPPVGFCCVELWAGRQARRVPDSRKAFRLPFDYRPLVLLGKQNQSQTRVRFWGGPSLPQPQGRPALQNWSSEGCGWETGGRTGTWLPALSGRPGWVPLRCGSGSRGALQG